MGLDMYLYRKTYVKNWDHNGPERHVDVTVLRGGQPIPGLDVSKVAYIVEEVAYWRKANQIHGWFVKEIQGGNDDCGSYYVSTDRLGELVKACEAVLADHSLAQELLPPQSGFFFGGTELDEYYFGDLEETAKLLKPLVIETADMYAEYEYQSSW